MESRDAFTELSFLGGLEVSAVVQCRGKQSIDAQKCPYALCLLFVPPSRTTLVKSRLKQLTVAPVIRRGRRRHWLRTKPEARGRPGFDEDVLGFRVPSATHGFPRPALSARPSSAQVHRELPTGLLGGAGLHLCWHPSDAARLASPGLEPPCVRRVR